MKQAEEIKLLDEELEVATAIKNLISKQIAYSLHLINGQSGSLLAASTDAAGSWAKTSSSYSILSAAQDLSKFESQMRTIELALQSLNKIRSFLLENDLDKKIITVSGGFDPIHIGHIRMIKDAAKLGRLTVIVNSDDWLNRKKGFAFMPEDERVEILKSIDGVSEVVVASDSDDTVCESLRQIKPNIFANGGDRTNKNTPEKELCKELGIEMVWGVGGKKLQSSSELVKNSEAKKTS